MTTGKDDFVLGEGITKKARKGTAKETAVISVRLTTAEVARLEAMSKATSLGISQIIRDAIATYEVREPSVAMGSWTGTHLGLGNSDHPTGMISPAAVSYDVVNTALVKVDDEGRMVHIHNQETAIEDSSL